MHIHLLISFYSIKSNEKHTEKKKPGGKIQFSFLFNFLYEYTVYAV